MKFFTLFTVGVALLLASCVSATKYQKIGTDATGGHSFRRISDNTFAVEFSGNGATKPKKAADFAMLRAAEVTLEHGYRFFSILGEEDLSSRKTIDIGGTAHTTGTVTDYGGFGTYSGTTTYNSSSIPVSYPATRITIKCYDKKPGGHAGKVYEARSERDSLRAQYQLTS